MITALIIIFIVGYMAIALEHPIKVDKTASALVLGMLMWILYALGSETIVPSVAGAKFDEFLSDNPSLAYTSVAHQTLEYVLNVDIIEHLGDICQTILFLLGAMTIVELIDVHGGFRVITDRIRTRDKKRLLWIVSFTTFFMSAILDNLTTSIVMLMLLRKLIEDRHERWLYAGAIVLAANSGGAWSPIGDVTTIMLWVKGNVTAAKIISFVLLPSLVSMLIPVYMLSRRLSGTLAPVDNTPSENKFLSSRERNTIFFLGVGGLIFVPIFKSVTHLPPFVGMLFIVGCLWIFTEVFYNHKMLQPTKELRLPKVVSRVDMPSILFFLGILMAVAVLQACGILSWFASVLDTHLHNAYIIDIILGIMSSIVDNVPMVAGVMGMYPVADPAATGYAANFIVDGTFWELLSYCAGVGGSILVIGSAAGVIAMGLEKITFGWYLRNISWMALLGYLCGVLVYFLEKLLLC